LDSRKNRDLHHSSLHEGAPIDNRCVFGLNRVGCCGSYARGPPKTLTWPSRRADELYTYYWTRRTQGRLRAARGALRIQINEKVVPNLDSLLATLPDNAADIDVRQLKMTIVALRQALEEDAIAREEFSRTLQAAHKSEISQLKATIAALRAQLEQMEQNSEAAVTRAKADAADEIAQLRQTIVSLRGELERSRDEHEQHMQRLNALTNDKAVQLQLMITALHAQLEETTAKIASEKQAAVAIATSEINQLRETCRLLRQELDQARTNAQGGKPPNADAR
jgi:chromosome segregation ATPase